MSKEKAEQLNNMYEEMERVQLGIKTPPGLREQLNNSHKHIHTGDIL
jgi:hypothetical protein